MSVGERGLGVDQSRYRYMFDRRRRLLGIVVHPPLVSGAYYSSTLLSTLYYL